MLPKLTQKSKSGAIGSVGQRPEQAGPWFFHVNSEQWLSVFGYTGYSDYADYVDYAGNADFANNADYANYAD